MASREEAITALNDMQAALRVRIESRWAGGTLQAHLEMLFHDYCKEYGEGYDRTTFLDFVVATLFEPGDVKILIAAYEQRLQDLRTHFPE